ncbi:MAG: TIGR02757 family protein [Planctomycetota bacterium]
MAPILSPHLGFFLQQFIQTFPVESALIRDPVQFPRSYSDPRDQEVSGLIASCLAYGQVTQFIPKLQQLLNPMGGSPHQFLKKSAPKQLQKICKGFHYRFTKEQDIYELLRSIQETLNQWDSLEKLFRSGYQNTHESYEEALSHFVGTLRQDRSNPSHGFAHLLPLPQKKSPVKRLCLFLRWMIRKKDQVDLGTWGGFPTHKLIIPLDTHISRIAYQLGLVEEGNATLRRAREITVSLKQFDAEDPLKYDFPPAHLGISGQSPKRQKK